MIDVETGGGSMWAADGLLISRRRASEPLEDDHLLQAPGLSVAHGDLSFKPGNDFLGDGHAKTRAWKRLLPRDVDAEEGLEDLVQPLLRNAGTGPA
jgi:hypothetical protein